MTHIARSIIIPLIVVIVSSQTVLAQYRKNIEQYYTYYNAAFKAEHEGKADSAIYYCRQALRCDTDNNNLDGYLGRMLVKRGAYKDGVAMIQKQVATSGYTGEFQYLFDNYDSVKQQPDVVALSKRMPELVHTYYSTLYNIEFGKMIYEMMGRDQAVRSVKGEMYSEDSIKRMVGSMVQARLDTGVNLPIILAYLKDKGFPKQSEMDAGTEGNFKMIIHHIFCYDGPKVDELHHLVQQAIYNGRYSPYAYMQALDWSHINKTGKQLYGTYMAQGADNRYHFDPPIENLKDVDARRAAWRQKPLKQIGWGDWRDPVMPAEYKP